MTNPEKKKPENHNQDQHTTPSRRRFLSSAASSIAAGGILLANQSDSEAAPKTAIKAVQKKYPIKAISSHNGLQATKKAYELIVAGKDTLDACIAGVNIVEKDPNDITVGYGGLPNEEGTVELDAAVMHGPTHLAGSVASLQNIKTPSNVAKLVMEQTDHELLVGPGALKFAKAHGFKEEKLLTEKARKIWLYWKQSLNKDDDHLPPPDDKLDPEVAKFFKRPTGTIHCAGMNAQGDISCVTSTSGLFFKIPGRVGDSPIIGAGLYVDNKIGSCGSTGRGEANLQNLCSFAAVELMRGGKSPKEAGLEVLRRVAENTVSRLKDKQGRPTFNLAFYLIAKDGTHAGVSMWDPVKYSITDEKGTRHEMCTSLYEGKGK